MDSKLKLGRKVPDKNDMQSLEGRERDRDRDRERVSEREREREREKKKKKGAHSVYALEHNDACSDTVNKVDLDSESMAGSRCRSYDGETSVTFRSNIT